MPTPSGQVEVSVPASSQSGSKLRLAGRGIPSKTQGDLYVVLQCVVPPAKTDQERQVYEDMERHLDFNPRERLNV